MNKTPIHTVVKSILLIIFVICIANNNFGQKRNFFSDSIHSPRKATIYSAVLPGLGQAYNEKFWKIPIVYAVIGGCLTAAIINNKDYNVSRDELKFRKHNSRRLNSDYLNFEDAQLLELTNYSRKWRDNMFIFTGVAYMLNIVDANVDAHLFNFNVDDNLSMNITPYTYSQEINSPIAGLRLRFSFR
ncbi:DUF5683 domain-containing protein [Flavobacteriales bacterium]|nr:DUF5683 domain-containing protein [Flavobacteriales bacterium]